MTTEGSACFGSPAAPGSRWNLRFGPARDILSVHGLDQVVPALDRVEAETRAGRWAVLVLAHEAAPALDPAFRVHPPADGFPLLWAAFHDRPLSPGEAGPATPPVQAPDSDPGGPPPGAWRCSPWRPLVDRPEYDRAIAAIRELIRQGEVYQVNYTLPFEARFQGDDQAWHHHLAGVQGAGYPARVDMGGHRLLCLSPELFFRRRGEVLAARPMKGTMPRGRFPAEDEALRAALAACPKNRAENVMIADLVRNDLGRVARTGTVRVPALFRVEAYPSVFQMTSLVTARTRPGVGLAELFAALFPCGSVTGAPKIRAVAAIRDLERFPRGAYCGAVGYVAPGGDCVFCVPIRTVVLDPALGLARFGVGGGVTHDSTAGDEYEECRVKMGFLAEPAGDFRLLESLLLANGRLPLRDRHLERLSASARRFGFRVDRDRVLAALGDLAARHPRGRFKVRLLADRLGNLEAEAQPLPSPGPRPALRLALAPEPVDPASPFLFHKTTRREVYATARAARPQADETVLWNARGEITEACTASLVVERDGEWLTPALDCGLLDGVSRAMLLARGVVREAVILREDLQAARRIWLVNAVRGWRRAVLAQTPPGTGG